MALRNRLTAAARSGLRRRRPPAATPCRTLAAAPPLPPDNTPPTPAAPTLDAFSRLGRYDNIAPAALLFWPGALSIALASPLGAPLAHADVLLLFGAGSVVMRGAGCTVNDLWDRDLDGRVARTAARPLASGELGVPAAVAFLGAQLGAGLGVLLSLRPEAWAVGAASLPLVALYPLAKRYTDWPQAVLGLTFNWGALAGCAAVTGAIDWAVCGPLFAGCGFWTLVYDTLYAHQDKADDVKIGVRSSALALGDAYTKPALTAFAGAAVAGWAGAGAAAGLAWPFYAGVAGAGGHLLWQVWTADLDDPNSLAPRFKANALVGAGLFASAVAGSAVAGM